MNKYSELCIDIQSSLLSALQQMDSIGRKLLIVVKEKRVHSLISIGDIQRAIIAKTDLDTPVSDVLRKDVRIAKVTDNLEEDTLSVVLEEGEILDAVVDIDTFTHEESIDSTERVVNKEDNELIIQNFPLSNISKDVFLDSEYGPIKPSLSQALGNFGIVPFNKNKDNVFASDNNEIDIEDAEDVSSTMPENRVLLAEENGFEISQIISDEDTHKLLVSCEEDLFPILSNFIRVNHNFNGYTKFMTQPENNWDQPRIVALGGDICNDSNHELFNEFAGTSQQDLLKIFSFNVKIEITLDNMRESFFQTVSNSNWSNEGYLALSSIEEQNNRLIRDELKRLSALYGIGVILLDTETPGNSEIISLSEARHKIDLNFVNKLISNSTNNEFRDFIANINEIKKSGQFNKDFFDNIEANTEIKKINLK